MKTLFIERIYLHGHGGGPNAARAFINALAEISDELTLFYPQKEGKEAEYIADNVSMVPSLNNYSKLHKGLLTLVGQLNFLHDIPSEFLVPGRFDLLFLVVLNQLRGLSINSKNRAKIITLHHNYEYEYVRDNARKLFKLSQLSSVKHAEKRAIQLSDLNLCLTSDDIELFKRHYDKNANYALAGTFDYQTKENKTPKQEKSGKTTFIITGDLSFKQSNASILPWIHTYYPILKEVRPNSLLIIAGRNPSYELQTVCKEKGIELIASPENMDYVLIRGDYYICPIDLGGGIKIRCMDGLKWGMPVLAHKVSARGYQSMIQQEVFQSYDSAESFRNSLKSLLAINKRPQEVIDAYNSYFSYENGKKRLLRILKTNKIL